MRLTTRSAGLNDPRLILVHEHASAHSAFRWRCSRCRRLSRRGGAIESETLADKAFNPSDLSWQRTFASDQQPERVSSTEGIRASGFPRRSWNLQEIIRELQNRKNAINRVIQALEQLQTGGDDAEAVVAPSRRGRKSMGEAERRAVAERMRLLGEPAFRTGSVECAS